MKPVRSLTTICLIALTAAACVPRQIRPVSEIDPSTMLQEVNQRRSAFENGVSGILETTFRRGIRRYSGRAYIVAFPGGPFRLEIPAPMGSTMLVMVNDGQEVTAYYPEEGKAYLSLTDGLSINPHLPFPLPFETDLLTSLLMGTVPEGDDFPGLEAHLLESGEKRLTLRSGQGGLEFTYLFTGERNPALRLITAQGHGLDLEVTTRETPPYLPEDFSLTFRDTRITGTWEKAAIYDGDGSVLTLPIPETVPVTDLRDQP